MFRRGEVWSCRKKAVPQTTTKPKQHEDNAEKEKVNTSRLNYGYGTDKHGKQSSKSAYSWVPPKPKSGVTE